MYHIFLNNGPKKCKKRSNIKQRLAGIHFSHGGSLFVRLTVNFLEKLLDRGR